ncbi:hypothetical protein N7528_001058 [Penicillium herquei]|nr:hypothetical protein N7528_001058 [Penicillium herquei]
MPREWDYPVTREGFSSAWGKFYTERGHIQRKSNQNLRLVFLPNITKACRILLLDKPDFVRAQLQHYGVAIDESRFSGNGSALMQEVLRAGGCHTVPPHILNLKQELVREWKDAETERRRNTKREFESKAEWVVHKHFLDDKGQPDRSITTTVVGEQLLTSLNYTFQELSKFAKKIDGLFYQVGHGRSTHKFFMGWDQAAVAEAAENYKEAERKEKEDAERRRFKKRSQLTEAYYFQAQKRLVSPVGSYIVDSANLEGNSPSLTKDMTIDIHPTDTPGIFKAEFNFGVAEGIMIIGRSDEAVAQYSYSIEVASKEEGDDEDGDKDEDKPADPAPRGEGSKKSKKAPLRRMYQLCLRGRDADKCLLNIDEYCTGTILFCSRQLVHFTADVDLPGVGNGHPWFDAWKVSDTPDSYGKEWNSYMEDDSDSDDEWRRSHYFNLYE